MRLRGRAVRRWWLAFGASALALAAVLALVSAVVLDLERKQLAAADHAAHQERVRLALWRMDSWLAPRLAREAARPYFEYSPYYPQERAYTRMLQPLDAAEVLTASPLLTFTSEIFPLHFQVGPDGVFASPQRPQGSQLVLALDTCIASGGPAVHDMRVATLATRIDYAGLLAATARSEERLSRLDATGVTEQPHTPGDGSHRSPGDGNDSAFGDAGSPTRASERDGTGGASTAEAPQTLVQELANQQELWKRAKTAQSASANVDPAAGAAPPVPAALADAVSGPQVDVGPLVPVWYDGSEGLLYARRVVVGPVPIVQGLTVDWPVLRRSLLAEVLDLFPGATLQPLPTASADSQGLTLATLPAALVAPEPPAAGPAGLTPVRWALLLVWVVAALAAGAAGHTVHTTLELGERRSRFASAVTHELRTPLTTFRMYSEMLADGMVRDEATRGEYLRTLRDESERLSRLVENVLAYARLEEGRTEPRLVTTVVGTLLQDLRAALVRRAAEARLVLEIDAGDAADCMLPADATIVGQILFNLVDNAAKYASGAVDPRVHLLADVAGGSVRFTVSDHGPGVPRSARARIFEPFERDAPDAVPGVGLGLALARGLARRLGGELLLLDDGPPGAAFRLVLPLLPGE